MLNPNGTDALFSNAGPWVRAHAQGASVMSTMPAFQGGLQPVARLELEGRTRESIDPDDYSGLFAPSSERHVVRGAAFRRSGRRPAARRHRPHQGLGRGDAVSRGWMAVAALTSITT